jgi:hypothetical protein
LMPRKYGYSIGWIGHGISVISSLLALSNVPRPVSVIINLRYGLKPKEDVGTDAKELKPLQMLGL